MAYDPHFPLAEVIESSHYPLARTQRTSFKQKLWDTYNVLAGEAPFLARKPHVGIFDYLTLYIPVLTLGFMGWCFDNAHRDSRAALLVVPSIIINIPLVIARVAFGAAATILFSPITALVHGISDFFSAKKRAKALDVKGKLSNGKEASLAEHLAQKNLDIEELDIKIRETVEEKQNSLPTSSYKLMFWTKPTGPSNGLICQGCMNGGCASDHAPFTVEVKEDKDGKLSENVYALFKLNVGDVTTVLEEDEEEQTHRFESLRRNVFSH